MPNNSHYLRNLNAILRKVLGSITGQNEFAGKYKSNVAPQLVCVLLTLRRLVIGSLRQRTLTDRNLLF